MKITVTDILPTPSGLRLGLRVEHEKAGWLRFATTVLVLDDLSNADRASLVDALNKASWKWDADELQEPLFS